MKKIFITLAASLLTLSAGVAAEVSATVKLASDYTFNGVSYSDNEPALQASVDYAADSGFYAGTWASNIDLGAGDDTNVEWDAYAGQFFQLTQKLGIDAGIGYYTYHGDSGSDAYNYPEIYTKFSYNSSLGDSALNFWYSWDYFGLAVNSYIVMLAHTVEVAPGHNIKATFDRTTSADKTIWAWDGKDAYNHYRIEYMTNWQGFDFDLAFENTSMDIDTADARVVLAISRTFSL